MTILLHIGYHKTGTTWLQKSVFGADPAFRVVAAHDEVDRFIVRPNMLLYDAQAATAAFAARRAGGRDEGRIEVISSEIMSGNAMTGSTQSVWVAERLRALFPDGRILVTIRRQNPVVLSLYKQYVKRGGRLTFGTWIDPCHTWGFYGFNARHFEYDRLICRYMELFGAGNVKVMLHEHLSRDPAGFCSEVAAFAAPGMELDLQTLPVLRRNVSSSDAILPALRLVNAFRCDEMNPAPLINLGSTGWFAYRAISRLGAMAWLKNLKGPTRRMTAALETRFGADYARSNRRLEAMTGLDLSFWGYAVADEDGRADGAR